MDGFSLSDLIGVIAACAGILAILIAYLVMVSQYLSTRYTPLIIPVFLRRLATPWRRRLLIAALLFLLVAIIPEPVRVWIVPIRSLAALLTAALLLGSLVWLSIGMYQLLVETVDSVRVVGWLQNEESELRQVALREIIVPALARMDLAAINAAVAQAIRKGEGDEKAVLDTLLAQRRFISAEWIASHLLGQLLSGLNVDVLTRRRAVIEAMLAESLRAGLSNLATDIIKRLFTVLQAARPWQRVHSEIVSALGDIVWEVRPSDISLPHHPWLSRPHADAEDMFIQYLRQMRADVCRPTANDQAWPLSLQQFCEVLHWLTMNALNPVYLDQLLQLYEQIVWFCLPKRPLEGPVVQELSYGLASARTCVYKETQSGSPGNWDDATRRIDELAVDLAALVASTGSIGLLMKVLQSAAFGSTISYVCLKPEVIPMNGYDELAGQWRIMPFSEWERKKAAGETIPDQGLIIRTLHGLTQPPIIVGPPAPWSSN